MRRGAHRLLPSSERQAAASLRLETSFGAPRRRICLPHERADTLDSGPWWWLLGVSTTAALTARLYVSHLPGRKREIFGWLLLVTPTWVLAAGLFANAYLDCSPEQRHASEVLRLGSPPRATWAPSSSVSGGPASANWCSPCTASAELQRI
jgi:hypothetical protein